MAIRSFLRQADNFSSTLEEICFALECQPHQIWELMVSLLRRGEVHERDGRYFTKYLWRG